MGFILMGTSLHAILYPFCRVFIFNTKRLQAKASGSIKILKGNQHSARQLERLLKKAEIWNIELLLFHCENMRINSWIYFHPGYFGRHRKIFSKLNTYCLRVKPTCI